MIGGISPNVLAIASAFFIAVARLLYQSALGRIDPNLITFLVNLVSVIFAALYYSMTSGVERWPLQGLLWFVAVGFAGSMAGRYLSFVSQRLVGAARTSIVIQTMLVWSTLLAVLFLGESLTFWVVVGSLFILAGGVFLVWERTEIREKQIPWIHYLVPLGSALILALTFLLRRYGLAWLPSAPLGMGVANGTSCLFLMAFLGVKSRTTGLRWNVRAVAVASLGGFFNSLSALCLWTAVQTGEIVQVVPINRLSILFIIVLAWLFFRKEEAITWRVVAGGVFSVIGAYLIVVGK